VKKILLLFLLVSVFANAQRSRIDSLLVINDYLSEIRNIVNENNIDKAQRLQKLKILVKKASEKEKKFKSNLKEIIPTNNSDYKMMTNRFHLILQSLVLYKSDISNNNESLSEKKYLNQNIPALIDKINYQCKISEEKINFKAH